MAKCRMWGSGRAVRGLERGGGESPLRGAERLSHEGAFMIAHSVVRPACNSDAGNQDGMVRPDPEGWVVFGYDLLKIGGLLGSRGKSLARRIGAGSLTIPVLMR